ncbi:MAG: polyprenyl synthetase family protein [Candidatus Bathyarchaeota archaeon]|nr:MAG: polyprenyl synthetase family protein [Candidatus Bathyarchaeota archaeon]
MSDKKVKTAYGEEGYLTYIENARRIIDFDISQIMPMVADLGLFEKIKYVLRTRGKRLRPIMVLLSAQSVGGRLETVRKLALAIEMLHAASLIHDDILDQDIIRRNKLTANMKWGIRDAVLVGDVLASLSLYLSADYESEITKVISQTCVILSDGEYLDLKEAMNSRKESDYIETTRRKSASLFKASTQCGAIAAKAKPDEIKALSVYGENFGLAYQIKDDLSDIIPLKDALPQDIKIFRATLPIIHLCESAKPEVKEKLFQAIASISVQNPDEKENTINMLREHLESTGSLRYCARKINQFVTNANASLEPLKESLFKGYLIEMANSLRLK